MSVDSVPTLVDVVPTRWQCWDMNNALAILALPVFAALSGIVAFVLTVVS